MIRALAGAAAATALLAAATTASAAPTLETRAFRTPSGNIGCFFGSGTLRCDILETSASIPRRPASCQQDWGRAFEMTKGGRARRICVGDTTVNPGAPRHGYGRVWARAAFVCFSRVAGLECTNSTGNGWKLSRQRITLS
jgi:hypothetical protein